MSEPKPKKCGSCSAKVDHKFKDCESTNCECGCLMEIYHKPVDFQEMPSWFKKVPIKGLYAWATYLKKYEKGIKSNAV